MIRIAKIAAGILAALLPLVCVTPAVLDFSEPLQILSGDLQMKVLAQAQPDECFAGIGLGGQGIPPCGPGSVPKVNQAYIWGMTSAAGQIWFGTVANTECLVMAPILGTNPIQTPTWVCEYGQSQYVQSHYPGITAAYGDWRPPQIFAYNLATNSLVDKTAAAGSLIGDTTGLRSAGTLNNVVLLAGPSLTGGANFFAFRASDGAFLDATKIAAYNDIRRWEAVDGVLYCGVGVTGGGGAVLRWTGDAANPFQFQVVGSFSDQAWDLAYHQGRLFVVTWPIMSQTGATGNIAALIMGPTIPPGGLTSAQANPSLWVKVWKATDYEPDALTARSYGAGALKSFGGWLYWGTMHIPLAAAIAATQTYGIDYANAVPGTGRAIALFRGRNFGTAQQALELLYGEQYLPVYDSVQKIYTTGSDALHQNKMPNPVPTWGHSGFGLPFNTYTWSMEIYRDKLYVGTFDFAYLMDQFANGQIPIGIPPSVIADFLATLPTPQEGADLYRFDQDGKASLVSNDGIGNYLNYGVRNMQTIGGDLFLGMANPMNLATDPAGPRGGWKLIRLTGKNVTPVMSLLLED